MDRFAKHGLFGSIYLAIRDSTAAAFSREGSIITCTGKVVRVIRPAFGMCAKTAQ